MLNEALIDMALYVGCIIAMGLPAVALGAAFDVPSEVVRKLYHMVITFSIFPLVHFFDTWYLAVLALVLFATITYPILMVVENSSFYRRIAVEREDGEFKSSLIVVQLSIALLLFIAWGVLGAEWRYVAVVAVMAWGLGDAAAALVGKHWGRRRIEHPRIQGAKTVEGTLAMLVVAALAIFVTLIAYAGHPSYVSLIVALLVAPVCAVVELFSSGVTDTVTVPLSAALTTLPLLYLFSLVGG